MELIKWEPFGEFDRLFENDFFSKPQKLGWDLAVDVYEEKGNVVAKMTLPLVKPDDIDVTIEDDVLTVSGRRDEEEEIDEKDYYSKEIRRGSFSRSVRLPKSVKASEAKAVSKDGELTITMPRIENVAETAVKVDVIGESSK